MDSSRGLRSEQVSLALAVCQFSSPRLPPLLIPADFKFRVHFRAPPATAPKLQLTEAQLRSVAEKTISHLNWMLENLYAVGVSKDKVLVLKV